MVEEGLTLEYTPTWVVASLCTVIVAISLVAERLLHYTGKYLKKKNQKPLFQALQKIKEELMLLGFISLLLAVFQSRIEKLCISENTAKEWLPCKLTDASSSSSTTTHFQTLFTSFIPGRLLAEATATAKDYCAEMGISQALADKISLKMIKSQIPATATSFKSLCCLTLRCVSFISIISVSMFFFFIIEKGEYSRENVVITYVLVAGAIILELYAAIFLLCSDWMMLSLKKHSLLYQEISSLPCTRSKRWSNTMAQHNLISTCQCRLNSGAKNAGKVPVLSPTALHHLHIFIFVLAVVHVTFCALTILFGGVKIRLWKHWEDSISKKENDPEEVLKTNFTLVQDHDFIRNRFLGFGKDSALSGWVHSFFKQFYGSVTKTDYLTMRLGFIMTHCRGNPQFNFHKYMIRTLEADFKKVVGISWYLWLFVVIFLVLDVAGRHAYFWISFIPFILLLAVGTKLEHVIIQLAHEVAEKHVAIAGDLVVQPSDNHFWFNRPRIVLLLIHFILFQNSFEIAFFFWIWVQYGFDSCMMGEIGYIIPRLVIGVFIQFLCSYSTLPLYVIVTQMGSSYKKAIFEEHIQEGLVGWARMAKKNNGLRKASNGSSTMTTTTTTTTPGSTTHASSQMNPKETTPTAIQMSEVSAMEEGNAGEIAAATLNDGHS